ncbi:Acid protease [Mycena kentingensis (nom. inval.)]|nr:Acid protease [Mycena kentingensis (nom. inval.)]
MLLGLTVLSLSYVSCAKFATVRHDSAHLEPAPATSHVPPASFVAPITAKVPRRKSKQSSLRSVAGARATAPVYGALYAQEYLVDMTVDGQKFPVIVDTGSSDTWLVKKGFKCFNLDGVAQSQSTCSFGSSGFDTSSSPMFKLYPKVSFNISYADGEFLTGPVGFDTVSVGGLAVKQQEIGVPDYAAWNGDSVNSGLLGLAYPELTSVFNTTDPTKASRANHIPYDPFFFTAVKQGIVEPYFSLSLNRGGSTKGSQPNLGFLAFGGIAPVPVDKTTVTLPVERTGSDYWFYTIDVDAYVFSGSDKTKSRAILDSGTTLNYLPSRMAAAYNALFVPRAQLDKESGIYVVDCASAAPEFSVVLGGKRFVVDVRDQVVYAGSDENGEEVCISGTQDGGVDNGENIFILGDVFLHNVVSTFNIKTNEMTVTQRRKY